MTVRGTFNVDSKTAKGIISLLKRRGYIEPIKISGKTYWKNTIKGNSLALSSAAPPISRTTAERKLKEFLDRVLAVRNSKYYLYKVTKVVVFGSYLSDKDKINDVDLSISLIAKEKNRQRRRKLEDERIHSAISYGKVFGNVVEQVLWPQFEVIKFLKGHSRSIGLHIDEEIAKKSKHKIIYRDDR
ncbi:MAG: hypothetical protein WC855_14985 [Thermodesulfovibrionales bacterium]